MIKTAVIMVVTVILTVASALAADQPAATRIYQKPLLPNPVDEARFYIYDPATNSDRNITWSDLKAGVLTIQSNGDVQNSPKLVVKDSTGAVKLVIDASGKIAFK